MKLEKMTMLLDKELRYALEVGFTSWLKLRTA